MADIHEHVAYLSQGIGPRPAGTEEEQQAALYITEQLQKDAGLPASIEDFKCNPDADLPRAVCSALVVIAGILAIFVAPAVIPALVVSALAAAVFVAESLGKPVVSRLLNRGVSQNVVAKYEPAFSAEAGSSRRRKIVLVAHYDSGKVQPETSQPLLGVLPIVAWAALDGMVVSVVILLIRIFVSAEGAGSVILNVVTVLAALCAAWPLLITILHRASSYNEGANCNAAGVAVLMDVASRVGRGRVSAAELEQMQERAVVHGEQAAREAGLAPEGGELVYEVPAQPHEESAAERLLSAKAAVAALTGMPVSETINIDLPEEDPAPDAPSSPDEDVILADADPAADVASQEPAASSAADEPDVIEIEPEEKEPAVPEWFRSAQQKAKKTEEREVAVQRSRYAEALDAAQLEQRLSRFSAPAESSITETEQRLQQMRESIMEVKAPGFRREEEPASSSDAAPAPASSDTPAAETPADGSTIAFRPVPLDIPAAAEDVLGARPKENPAAIFGEAVEDLRAQEDVTLREPRPLTGSQADPDAARMAMAESLAAAIPSIQTPAAALAEKVPAVDSSNSKSTRRKRRAISLPSIGSEADDLVPLDELSKQPAPLDEERQPATGRVHDLRAVLPSIGGEPASASTLSADSLPSLSGSLGAAVAVEEEASSEGSVSIAGAFSAAGSTGAFSPVGDELLEDVDPDEVYIEDADDSDYEEVITETGAFSGPGYVDMPKSRASRFFGKFGFGRKKRQEELTPQEWLDVDDEFDAQSAGAARGGWESFREDDNLEETYEDGYYDEDYEDDGEVYEALYEEAAESAPRGSRDRAPRWNGGAFSREQLGRVSTLSQDMQVEEPAEADPEPDELEAIYRFHNPDINTEVWFVALGAELAANGGMNAFLDEHAQELRGAIVIDLDALGAGELTLIEREGTYLPRQASSRMRRLVKKASAAVGLTVGTGTMLWMDSAAACAMRRGCQTMHLAGMENGKPARFGQSDDVAENVSGEVMSANADFVMELLKNI